MCYHIRLMANVEVAQIKAFCGRDCENFEPSSRRCLGVEGTVKQQQSVCVNAVEKGVCNRAEVDGQNGRMTLKGFVAIGSIGITY